MDYGTVATLVVAITAVYLIGRRRESTIRGLVGPPSPSWIFGHMLQLMIPREYGEYEFTWPKRYGPVYRLKGCFGEDRLMVSDPLALQYILNSANFHYSRVMENTVHLVFGHKSMMGVKGEAHRKLRAAMNPGFSAAAVRNYQDVFEKVAHAVTERLEDTFAAPIDMCPLLSTATLSSVTEIVLGHSTDYLGDEFIKATGQIMAIASSQSAGQIIADAISSCLPLWLLRTAVYLPTKTFEVVRKESVLANKIGSKIVREKLDVAQQGLEPSNDIYSMLLTPVDSSREPLGEADAIAQTAIMMIAGGDTTTNTLVFGFVELAKNPEFQEQLRAEIHANRGKVAYDNMPLLNAFIKETLRVYPAEPLSDRVALQDTVIPLAESITTSAGERITQIPVRKGQVVTMGISSFHSLDRARSRPSSTFPQCDQSHQRWHHVSASISFDQLSRPWTHRATYRWKPGDPAVVFLTGSTEPRLGFQLLPGALSAVAL
ncbi:cytochrome P450 [Mycena crocata]|nr:cytochrome P450 [Mycena crocata]